MRGGIAMGTMLDHHDNSVEADSSDVVWLPKTCVNMSLWAICKQF